MFDLGFIVIIFGIMMVLSVVLFFVSRMLFRIVVLTTTILLIFMLVVGVIVIQDAQKLNQELARGPTAYILNDNGTALAGFIVHSSSNDTIAFNSTTLNELMEKKLPLNSTNAFTIDILAFENHTLTESDSFPSYLDMKSLIIILKSSNPFEDYANIAYVNDPYYKTMEMDFAKQIIMEELISLYSSDTTLLKSDLYMMILSRILSKEGEGPSFIFLEAKKGNVELYPSRITMRLVNIIPDKILSRTAEVV